MPSAERRRPKRARRLRCEACLEVLTLRHAWDVVSCSCGALTLSGRPTTPAVHWLGRPGGGWTEIDDQDVPAEPLPEAGAECPPPGEAEAPLRKLGFPALPTGGRGHRGPISISG